MRSWLDDQAVDLTDAPDLITILGALAAAADGRTRLEGAGHARFKESDRPSTVAAGIRALGGRAQVDEGGTVTVDGGGLHGGARGPGSRGRRRALRGGRQRGIEDLPTGGQGQLRSQPDAATAPPAPVSPVHSVPQRPVIPHVPVPNMVR